MSGPTTSTCDCGELVPGTFPACPTCGEPVCNYCIADDERMTCVRCDVQAGDNGGGR